MKRSFAVDWIRAVFCALPLIEVFRSFWGGKIEIGPLAVEEALLLFLALSALALGALSALREQKKKRLLAVGIALAVLLIYAVLHAWYAAGFDASLVPAANPSFSVELYYVLRNYLAPFALLGGAVLAGVTPKELLPAVKIMAALIAGVVVFSALTGLGFATYQANNTSMGGSVFQWIFGPKTADFRLYTAKGLFSDGNALSAVLFILTPLVCREALSEGRRWYDLALAFAVGAAGVFVGTRVASFGVVLAFFVSLAIAVLSGLRRREGRRTLWRCVPGVLILAAILGLFLLSPGLQLQRYRQSTAAADRQTPAALTQVLQEGAENNELLEPYMEEYNWSHFIDPWFLEVYPVENDPEFWFEAVERDGRLNRDNRAFKTEMIDRIIERDGRVGDAVLGIGVKSAGVPYSERDLSFQRQVYGILGAVLLLLPFAGAALFAGVRAVKDFFARRDGSFPLAVAVSVFCGFAAAYASGHVFDTIFTTYVLLLPAALGLSCREK